MTEFSTLLQQGNAWLFLPSAILLGALHGLEPGHSKGIMAAFIVAVGGTVGQAVLLGLSATLSHTAVVWLIAMAGLYFGSGWNVETSEPYLQVASSVLIVGVALWMLWRTWRQQSGAHGHTHDHDHSHVHSHGVATAPHAHSEAEDGDAHARAHAREIRERFANRQVSNGEIVIFGLTGGLIPCPASITILLLCLQLKKIALGATLVLGFSVGLAVTMVAAGVLAAMGAKQVARRWSGFGQFSRYAPYFSGVLIIVIGVVMGQQGVSALLA
ncbi:nickel/cobalt efflux transporter RcnA [Rhodocyclus tenuis]|uniref:Nickel/cobalt efflux system n=2 Tax=Rhodocyclus TaxID=1064 RepID=A0A6L5JUA7_RHOTE|nr:nickel/cobalt efflux transporter [Rhodocyclus gracilis]MQY50809.1 nickel/cobalt efflux transporter RcnA [Rhodocyclus gracilis]NJA87625.1 nickel/cobalt efflux transporter RcnA [Rhodocyclus gracilis]